MKGKLIVLTGIDGCGKDTQEKLLYKYLRNNNIRVGFCNLYSRTSYYDEVFNNIKNNLLDSGIKIPVEIRAVITAFIQYLRIQKNILPKLNAGYILIVNRYIETTDIYLEQRSINDFFRKTFNMSLSFDDKYTPFVPKDIFSEVLKPDLSFYLRVPVDVAIQRIYLRNREFQIHENKDMLQKVYNDYENKKELYNLISIDATQDKTTVLNAILKHIKEKIDLGEYKNV